MWVFIVLTIRAFAQVSKPAAWLLAPYLIWVSYATYLNAGYAYLNLESAVAASRSVEF
jgi:tryptophan-rich sensory protein